MSMSQTPDDILKVISSPQIVKLYANGFSIVMSNSDVSILLTHNNAPAAVLNLSYTTAKSLFEKVSESIKVLEKKSGQPIMTSDDIGQFLQDDLNDKNIS